MEIITMPGVHLSISAEIYDGKIERIRVFSTLNGSNQNLNEKYESIYKSFLQYLNGNNVEFHLPLNTDKLTLFQKEVYYELNKIPYGKTISYEELAKNVKNLNYRRAVAMALSKNPFPIVIPCHRVLSKSFFTARGFNEKQLGGFGKGIDVKKRLLLLENPDVLNKHQAN